MSVPTGDMHAAAGPVALVLGADDMLGLTKVRFSLQTAL